MAPHKSSGSPQRPAGMRARIAVLRTGSARKAAVLTLPNAVLTPHNAGMPQEVIDVGLLQTVENVRRFLQGAALSLA